MTWKILGFNALRYLLLSTGTVGDILVNEYIILPTRPPYTPFEVERSLALEKKFLTDPHLLDDYYL